MAYLGMELDANALMVVGHRGDRASGGLGDDLKTRWRRANTIAMAHPHRQMRIRTRVYSGEECVMDATAQRDLGGTILAPSGMRLDAPAKLVREQLHAVADTENRQSALQNRLIDRRRALIVDAIGATGENHALRAKRLNVGQRRGGGKQLAVDARLTYTPGDQPAVL